MESFTNKGICNNCRKDNKELFPVFIEGQTKVGKCDYWCKDCLAKLMANDPANNTDNMDDAIAYHEEMEQLAIKAGDFTKAEHHRKMQEIYKALKERQQPYKTPEQVSDEDDKVGPTSADKEKVEEKD